ncbi:MAG: hypothetical protein ACKODH_04415 [Limisphaerales bacterium]
MKNGRTILQTLLLGGVILATSNFSQPAQAAAAFTAANKTALDTAASIDTAVTQLINAASPADKADLAKQIVAYVAAKTGTTAAKLQAAVKAAVRAAGAINAPQIAAAAAQAASTSANAATLVSAVVTGAIQGGGVAADVQATLSTALPPALQAAVAAGAAAAAAPTQDVLPGGSSGKDNSTSSKS